MISHDWHNGRSSFAIKYLVFFFICGTNFLFLFRIFTVCMAFICFAEKKLCFILSVYGEVLIYCDSGGRIACLTCFSALSLLQFLCVLPDIHYKNYIIINNK